MDIKNLKSQWQSSFDEAIQSIENYIKPQSHHNKDEQQHVELAQWLLSTSVSPYDFLPNGWQNFRSEPFSTDSLLSIIHHALVDDGDICFVSLKLEDKILRHFIMFYPSYEDGFKQACFNENKNIIQSYINGRESHVRVMNSMIEKFPDKNFTSQPIITEKDFSFEIHHNSSLFIQQVESLEKYRIEKMLEIDKKMATLRNKK